MECKDPFFETGLIVRLRLNQLFPFSGCSVLNVFVWSSLFVYFDSFFYDGSDLADIVK